MTKTTVAHLFTQMTDEGNGREKSYDCILRREFLYPRQKGIGTFPPFNFPSAIYNTVLYIRLENKSSDGLFKQSFCVSTHPVQKRHVQNETAPEDG